MGIFDFLHRLFDKNAASVPEPQPLQHAFETPKNEMKPPEPPKPPSISEEDAERWAVMAAERVCQETRIPMLRISLAEEPFTIFDSHTGGLPYLPHDFEIPKDKKGEQMNLLAQINCEDLAELPDYPHEGMLQFWLSNVCWEEAEVTYHRTIDRSVTEEDAKAQYLQRTGDDYCSPLGIFCRMKFTLQEECMSRCDPRQMALYTQYYSELSGENITCPWNSVQSEIVDCGYDCLKDENHGSRHKVGGYRYSTQFWRGDRYDPAHPVNLDANDAPMLLFQLKSDYSYDYDNKAHRWIKALWCDAGVGHFLIRRADLLAGRYENAWFHWDCS